MSGKQPTSSDVNWPRDEFGRGEVWAQLWPILVPVISLLTALGFYLTNRFSAKPQPEVVVYCAQDQVYAEPILREFEKRNRIKVRPLFDSEAVKTVGLANRLLAEKTHPRCDLFWGNEEMRARQLLAKGVFLETNGWASFGYRSRRIVINTNLLSLADAPRSLLELTNLPWRGKLALAYPQFGTTVTHFHALRQLWGNAAWERWCRALAANKPLLLDGNSVVVRMVGRGEASLGLTDSDDIAAGLRERLPLAAVPINEETLLIPNVIAVVRGAPNPGAAGKLFEYLQKHEVVDQLIAVRALEGAASERPGLKVDWPELLRDLESTTRQLNEIFLR